MKFHKVTEAQFIFDSNYHRRHLTDDQKAILKTTFLPLFRKISKASRAQRDEKGKIVSINSTTHEGPSDHEVKRIDKSVRRRLRKPLKKSTSGKKKCDPAPPPAPSVKQIKILSEPMQKRVDAWC